MGIKNFIEVYDIECLINLFTYTGYDVTNKQWYQYVIHKDRNDYNELIKHLKKPGMIQVGFNNESYDYPIIHHLLNHIDKYSIKNGYEISQCIYRKSQEIIEQQFSTIADRNKFIKQIDLYKIWHYDNDARRTSLKDLEIAMRLKNVEEMPIHHTTWCSKDDYDIILSYNKNDVEATYEFLKTTLGKTEYSLYKNKNKIALRQNLQKKFGVNCLNLPDVRIGETLMLNLYSRAVNENPYYIKQLRTRRDCINLGECIPKWCNIKSKEFTKFLDKIKNTKICDQDTFSYSVIFHGISFDFGVGGAHGCIEPGIYESDENNIILDLDVSLSGETKMR